MPSGSIQTILVCAPSDVTQSPCPTGQGVTSAQVYVIDPAQAASIDAQNADFDYAYAAGVWSMAFTFVVALYLVSKSAGTIINAIRNL